MKTRIGFVALFQITLALSFIDPTFGQQASGEDHPASITADTEDRVRRTSDNEILMADNDADLSRVLSQYALETLRVSRIAVIDDRTTYGQGIADDFIRNINKTISGNDIYSKVSIVSRQYTNNRATDFRAILTSIKGNKTDLIFLGGSDATAAQILRQMRDLGMSVKFMGGDAVCTTTLPQLSGTRLADDQVICGQFDNNSSESSLVTIYTYRKDRRVVLGTSK